ncbi:MAG: hypothetical protein ACTS9Y_07825 [Methylophilus sp.]|uniref:hypothetical protein n=1 Tax=Methylophilus sp. TaxID=29541 RepID=UPI003F9EF19E
MNELRITQDKRALNTLPVLALSLFTCPTVAFYLITGLSSLTQAAVISTLVTTAWVAWEAYIASNRYVLISRSRRQITIVSMNLFGTPRMRLFPVNHFNAVRSYITAGNTARNVVELVTNDGKRGLVLCSFSNASGKKPWSFAFETENPHAANLANTVSAFMPVKNLGFLGRKLESPSVENNEGSFFSRIF